MLVNMNEILLPAKEGGYGVGFFNAVNVEMARAIIETAQELLAPVMDSACKIPMEADALCSTAVKAIPTRIPINGFENMVSVLTKCGFSFNGETAPLMLCIPTIKIEKPSMMSPTFL